MLHRVKGRTRPQTVARKMTKFEKGASDKKKSQPGAIQKSRSNYTKMRVAKIRNVQLFLVILETWIHLSTARRSEPTGSQKFQRPELRHGLTSS